MGSEDSRDMEDEGERGARQDAEGMVVPLSGDACGGGAKVGERGLGHNGARSWRVTHLMTSAIAHRPFDPRCPALCGRKQEEECWMVIDTGNALRGSALSLFAH